MEAMEISRTAIDIEWRRLELIAENLANAGTTGGGWQPKRLVTGSADQFAAMLDPAAGEKASFPRRGGVRILRIETSDVPERMVHEPGNPAADDKGMVRYAGIDHAAEMTLMVKTARVYEANVVAMNTARQMYSKALEIGRRA